MPGVPAAAGAGAPAGRSVHLTQAAFLNAVSSLLDYTSQLAVAFFVTPILIRSLDTSLYGVWKILQEMVNYMATVDGRPTQAVKWVIANQQASDDDLAKRRTVTNGFLTWVIYLPILSVVGGVLVWLSPSFAKVGPDSNEAVVVRITCGLLVLTFLITGLAQIPAAVLRGANQGYRRMGMQAGLNVVGAVLTVAAARFGFGLVGIGLAQVAIAVATAIFFMAVVKRYLPWFGLAKPQGRELRTFLGYSNWFLAGVIVNRLLFAADVLVLGYLTVPAMVTVYTVTEFASVTITGIIAQVVGSIVPGLGGLIGKRQYARAGAVLNEMRSYSWLLVTVIGATTLLANKSFIELWVGEDRYAGSLANMLIVLLAVEIVFLRNESYVIDLTLKIGRKVVLGLVAAAVSIGLAWLLIPPLGIVGLASGLFVGRLILIFAYPRMVRSFLGDVANYPLGSMVRKGAVSLALFVPATYVGGRISLDHWITWLLVAGAMALVTATVSFFGGFSADERRQALKRIGALRSHVGV